MKELISKSFTHTDKRPGSTAGEKHVIPAPRVLLPLLALIILLATGTGYFLQGRNEYSRESNHGELYPSNSPQAGEDTQKNENSPPPVIRRAKLQLESTGDTDRVKVVIQENPNEKKNITYNYEWLKNDQPFGGNEDHATGFKKGDNIDVKITPFDGRQYGQPILLNFTVARVPPKILENRTASFDGNLLSYQVKAVDPDGGTLSYSLTDAPKDMTIDSKTGTINWQPKPGEDGKRKVTVRIRNDSGAETIYPLNIEIAQSTR